MRLWKRAVGYLAERSWKVYCAADGVTVRHVNGRTIDIPLRRGLGRVNLSCDISEMQLALRAAQATGAAGPLIDIGANIGQSLLALLTSGIAAPYRGFEPDPSAASYLRELIRCNELVDAQVHSFGLGAADGTVALHTGQPGFVGSTLDLGMFPAAMYSRMQAIEVRRGDAVMERVAPTGALLVKLDVEGHEHAVLRGMESFIDRWRPPLYFEVLGYDHFLDGSYSREYFGGEIEAGRLREICEAREANGQALAALMREWGYTMYSLAGGVQREIHGIDLASPLPGAAGERNVFAIASRATAL